MIAYLKQFFTAPVFEADEEKTNRARVLNSLLVSITVILLLTLMIDIPFFAVNRPGALIMTLLSLAEILFFHFLMRRDRVWLASFLLVTAFWIHSGFAVFFSGGPTSLTPIFFLVTMVLAGLILGQKAAMAVALLSSATTLGMVILAAYGYHPQHLLPWSAESSWMILTLSLVIALIPLNLVLRTRDKALALARLELAERKQTEESLRRSEERLRLALNAARMGTWDWDIKKETVTWSEQVESIFGLQPGQFAGTYEAYLALIYPDDVDLVRRNIAAALTGGTTDYQIEHRVLMSDGSLHWLEGRGQVTCNEAGRPVWMAGTVADITERKQAEEALRLSEERYRNFVEQSVEGIWMVTFDEPIPLNLPPEVQAQRIQTTGYIAECNDAHARMYGYGTSQDLIGVRLLELYGGPSEPNLQSALKLVEAGYQASDRETREVSASGETVYFLNNAVGVIEQEQLVAIWGTQRDITPLKQTEAEREKLIADLEAKNTELERFTYTVSHDLKSPLITIRGFLGYLERDILTGRLDRFKADIKRIHEAADRMGQLLDDLLELSRIGRLVNPAADVPFEEIVQEALAIMVGQLTARRVTVQVAGWFPSVYGDRTRLVEVVQNLVENAAKFMGEQPEPRIEIGVRMDGEKPVFYVSDNGIGIEPPYHEKVFGLFDKLNPDDVGTGIGLALVQRIVNLHGGRIWIESMGQGRGTTVCFTLPDEHHK